ncbi:MAG TPA: hypothetical protein VI299_16000 [Polyangiales bacterium]
MQTRYLLRFTSSLFLAAALTSACSDDPSSPKDDDEDKTADTQGKKDAGKKDAGTKDAGKKDAGKSASSDEDEGEGDDDESDDSEDDSDDEGTESKDAKVGCTVDSDCKSSKDGGIACCDTDTNMCFMTQEEECPVPEDGGQMPSYN